jgi:hypothetical protein
MDHQTDERGHPFSEIPISGGHIRVTYITQGWDGSPSVRYQVRNEDTGRLRQGPEIPVGSLGEMFSATLNLLLST